MRELFIGQIKLEFLADKTIHFYEFSTKFIVFSVWHASSSYSSYSFHVNSHVFVMYYLLMFPTRIGFNFLVVRLIWILLCQFSSDVYLVQNTFWFVGDFHKTMLLSVQFHKVGRGPVANTFFCGTPLEISFNPKYSPSWCLIYNWDFSAI